MLVTLVATTALAAATSSPAGAAASVPLTEAERQFTDLLNNTRRSHGKAPLVVTGSILSTSRTWSGQMSSIGRLVHDPNLRAAMDRAVPGWTRIGENVGKGGSVKQLHDLFYRSAGHRANMLGDYNQVAFGIVMKGSTIWVTARFAKGPIPKPRFVPDHIGVRSADAFKLRSSNTTGAPTLTYTYGQAGDIAVLGDWDGNGTDTPGVFRNGTWYLRNSNSSGAPHLTFSFGQRGDTPVVGDWDGNGTDTIGVRRGNTWYLRNINNGGSPHQTFAYGNAGDYPVTGDWDGNGTDNPGVRRGNTWYLRNINNGGSPHYSFAYGNVGDLPVTGDWDANGTDTPGVRRGTTWFLRNANSAGTSSSFTYGSTGDLPLAGGF